MNETERENIQLKQALEHLISLYIANRGHPEAEFIACITPKHARLMTPFERRTDKYWSAWDATRLLIGDKV